MSGFDAGRLARLTPWMQGYVDTRRYPGCSVLVAQGGREVFYGDCGSRDVEGGKPWQRDTVARIYSMTKPVTSVALMMLVERGLTQLDAPLSEFIPAFADTRCLVPCATDINQTEPCAPPNLQQLLTHTSGLSYGFNPGVLGQAMEAGKHGFTPRHPSLTQAAERLAELPLAFRPGAHWEYSVGIDVIGRVVEIVSGQSLGDFFAKEIFEPLGMNETAFTVPKGAADRFAALYTPLDGDGMALASGRAGGGTLRLIDAPDGSPYHDTAMHAGGGGLVGTIDDYLKFTEMLRTGGAGIIGPKTLDFMMRNHLPGDIASMGVDSFAEQPMHGMGFGIGGAVVLDPARAGVPGSVGDFSWGGMASTFFWVDRALDLSVVFFTQLSPSSSYPARAQLKALIHGALA
jgi:CubicO group peptidase (beta-lactamase class C family)